MYMIQNFNIYPLRFPIHENFSNAYRTGPCRRSFQIFFRCLSGEPCLGSLRQFLIDSINLTREVY